MAIRRSALVVGFLALAGAAALGLTQPQGNQPEGNQPRQSPAVDLGQMLVAGLKQTEGCLGVEMAQTSSGKSVIMAWFEDREAVRRYYNHPTHIAMMRMLGGDPAAHTPLEHVAEDTPVLVIASLVMSQENKIAGAPMPISQIAIELYAPLPGGAYINGRMAPEGFPVEHMKNYTETGYGKGAEGGNR
ncbi:MAG: hypothetical protein ACF8R7_19015 [Phycisphaerales bacterium JB039]